MKDFLILRIEFTNHHLQIMHLLIGIGCLFIMGYFFVVLKRWRKEQKQAIDRSVQAVETFINEGKKKLAQVDKEMKKNEVKLSSLINEFDKSHASLKVDAASLKKIINGLGPKAKAQYDPTKDMFSRES